jgi:hypothetical protein
VSEAEDRGSVPPSQKTIERALAKVCRHGVEIPWVREAAGVLFDLDCVKERAERDFGGQEDALSHALIAILEEQVNEMRQTQYGKLLWVVFDFEGKYPETSATLRRTIAGQEFRDGSRVVTFGTIRQHHEPKAHEQLAARLLGLERSSKPA